MSSQPAVKKTKLFVVKFKSKRKGEVRLTKVWAARFTTDRKKVDPKKAA